MSLPSIVFDLICLAVVILCAVYYSRKGFVSGVFSFFGTLIALVAALLAANYLAPGIFDVFFRPGLEKNMAETIQQTGITNLNTLLEQVLGFLPSSMLSMIMLQLDPVLDFSAADIAQQVVTQVLQPLITPLIMIVLFFALFSLVRIFVGVIRSLAVGLNKVPAVNTVNRALGALIGVFIGALYVYIALCVVWMYDVMNPAAPFGSTYLGASFVFSGLNPLNFFA